MFIRPCTKITERYKHLLLANKFADSSENIYFQRDVMLDLDSVTFLLGDYKLSQTISREIQYLQGFYQSLGKQKDLLSIEIQNATKRAEQQKLVEEENKRTRNNIEYMGITAVIATVFIILVLLGDFKMSPSIIRAMGFFAFIFLFEFIVLLLDNQIQIDYPWRTLESTCLSRYLLFPCYYPDHWLEKKMTHYLPFKAHTIKSKIFHRKTEA